MGHNSWVSQKILPFINMKVITKRFLQNRLKISFSSLSFSHLVSCYRVKLKVAKMEFFTLPLAPSVVT